MAIGADVLSTGQPVVKDAVAEVGWKVGTPSPTQLRPMGFSSSLSLISKALVSCLLASRLDLASTQERLSGPIMCLAAMAQPPRLKRRFCGKNPLPTSIGAE